MVMHGKTKIRCNGYNKGKCNNSTTLSIQDIYSLIISTIKDTLDKGIINGIIATKKKDSINNQYDIIMEKLSQMDDKLERVKQSYRDGIDTLEEYKQNKEIIIKEKNKLNDELSKLEKPKEANDKKKEIIENGKKVYEILLDNNISIKEKNDIVNTLINKVEYDVESNNLELYYNISKNALNHLFCNSHLLIYYLYLRQNHTFS